MTAITTESQRTDWGAGSRIRWAGHPSPLENYQRLMAPTLGLVRNIQAKLVSASSESHPALLASLADIAFTVTPQLLWGFWLEQMVSMEAQSLRAAITSDGGVDHGIEYESPTYARKMRYGVSLTSARDLRLTLPAKFLEYMREISEAHAWLQRHRISFPDLQNRAKHVGWVGRIGGFLGVKRARGRSAEVREYGSRLDEFFNLVFGFAAIERRLYDAQFLCASSLSEQGKMMNL